MRTWLPTTRRTSTVAWTVSLLAVGASVVVSSEQLLAQNQEGLSDPCRAIAAHFETKMSCLSGTGDLDNGFRVEEFEEFDLPNKAKIALATIFNARSAKGAQLFNFAPLGSVMDENSAIDLVKNGLAYPAISIGNGKYYVFTSGTSLDDDDWASLWSLLIEGAKDRQFGQIGIATPSDDPLFAYPNPEKIFGWGSDYGLVLPAKE